MMEDILIFASGMVTGTAGTGISLYWYWKNRLTQDLDSGLSAMAEGIDEEELDL